MIYSLRSYLKKSIQDPQGAIFRILFGKKGLKRLCVRRLLQPLEVRAETISRYHEEILSAVEFNRHITETLAKTGRTQYGQIRGGDILYMVVRAVKPLVVVETGVAAGVSSAFILKALEENDKGILYSIDLPNYEMVYCSKIRKEASSILPPNAKPGFVIPHKLKNRWVLKIGKSSDILPELLNHLGRINLFLHDSEHTYENMMFEYNISWPYLSKGGILLSHDVEWNNAFNDFCLKVKRKPIYLYYSGMAGVIK